MRSNAMKTCAMGAMLFGGTLGAVPAAQASVVTLTWLGGDNFAAGGYTAQSLISAGTAYTSNFIQYSENAPGASINQAFNLSSLSASNASATLAFSGTNNFTGDPDTGGFSFSASNMSIGGGGSLYNQGFTVAGGQVEITLFLASGAAGDISIWDITNADGNFTLSDPMIASLGAPGTARFTLGPGTYFLSAQAGVGVGFSGEFMSFSVPAPGAAALISAAGLITSRRRKA